MTSYHKYMFVKHMVYQLLMQAPMMIGLYNCKCLCIGQRVRL